jgi:hypothetical protein
LPKGTRLGLVPYRSQEKPTSVFAADDASGKDIHGKKDRPLTSKRTAKNGMASHLWLKQGLPGDRLRSCRRQK